MRWVCWRSGHASALMAEELCSLFCVKLMMKNVPESDDRLLGARYWRHATTMDM